jgi:hypothetical protein
MSISATITIIIVGVLFLFCIIGIIIGLPGLVEEYPKEWEEKENEKFSKDLKKYREEN